MQSNKVSLTIYTAISVKNYRGEKKIKDVALYLVIVLSQKFTPNS